MISTLEPTERQLQIITYMSQGLANKEIASQLFITENTVKNHIHRICVQFKCKNRLEVVLFFLHRKYISNPFDEFNEEETCITVPQS